MENTEENEIVFGIYTVKYLIDVWIAQRGSITKIAKILNCVRPTVYKYYKGHEKLALLLNQAIESKTDDVENALFLSATGIPIVKDGKLVGWETKPDFKSMEKFLDTFGTERGYKKSSYKEEDKEPEARSITIIKKIITK